MIVYPKVKTLRRCYDEEVKIHHSFRSALYSSSENSDDTLHIGTICHHRGDRESSREGLSWYQCRCLEIRYVQSHRQDSTEMKAGEIKVDVLGAEVLIGDKDAKGDMRMKLS